MVELFIGPFHPPALTASQPGEAKAAPLDAMQSAPAKSALRMLRRPDAVIATPRPVEALAGAAVPQD
jgi:hypothetical protein